MTKGIPNSLRKLTIKQTRFITEYLDTGNACEAYRRAYDCSRKTASTIESAASRVLKTPLVVARLKLVQKKAFETQVVTKEWILAQLISNLKMAIGDADIPVEDVDEHGKRTKRACRKVDHASVNRAVELLGKLEGIGMFIDKSQVSVTNKFEELDDEELEDYIDERLR